MIISATCSGPGDVLGGLREMDSKVLPKDIEEAGLENPIR